MDWKVGIGLKLQTRTLELIEIETQKSLNKICAKAASPNEAWVGETEPETPVVSTGRTTYMCLSCTPCAAWSCRVAPNDARWNFLKKSSFKKL